MLPDEIKNYLNIRYERYLDYANYHASCAGIPDEGADVLNEVLLNLLEKPAEKIIELYQKQKKQYRELDFFILKMVKLNATSLTAPYRHKYKSHPIDANVNFAKLDIEDEECFLDDNPAEILAQKRLVYDIVDNRLNLTDNQREIFYHKFEGESFSDWQGPEKSKHLHDVFYKVRDKVIAEVEKDKRKKTADALLKTVEAEVKIIKKNMQFKNELIMEKKKDEAVLLNKEDLRELLSEMIPEAIKADRDKQAPKLLNVDALKRVIFDAIKTELISELNAMSA